MSVFYQARFEHLFPIPLLAFERIDALRHLPPEQVIGQVLAECCNKPKPTSEEITYFIRRVQGEVAQAAPQVESKTEEDDDPYKPVESSTKRRTLGSSFQEMISKMDSARLLLWACNWDYNKASYLYTVVDKSIAKQVIDDFIRVTQETNTYLFEAGLYGFGGSYSGDEPSSGDEVDASDQSVDDWKELLKGGLNG